MNLSEFFGFEEFRLQQLAVQSLTEENISDKKLVIISAPLDFDEQSLIGQVYIPNSSQMMNKDGSEEDVLSASWEMKTNTLPHGMNVVLPSSDSHQMVLSTLVCEFKQLCKHLDIKKDVNRLRQLIFPKKTTLNLNPGTEHIIKENISLTEHFHIPSIAYSDISKEKPIIQIPDGLQTRWKAFGQDDPPCKYQKSKKQTDNDETMTAVHKKKKKKKKKCIEETNNLHQTSSMDTQSKKHIESTNNIDNIDSTTKKHKKKKRKKSVDENENISIKIKAPKHNVSDSFSQKKKKKKNQIITETREESISKNIHSKKKKKKLK